MDAIDVVFPGASRLRNLESERRSDTEHFWPSISEIIQVILSDLVCRILDAYETAETLQCIPQAEVKAMDKLSYWEIVNNLDKKSFYQSVVSSASPIRERNGSITDASCGFKPNCKCSHHSHKNHTVQFSNVSLDENLEPIIYDTDVSKPCDRNHFWEFVSQTKPWIFDASLSWLQMYDFHPRAVGVAKGHIMTRNSSVRCPLGVSFCPVQMHDFYPRAVGVTRRVKRYIIKRNSSFRSLAKMLLGMGIEVPVSWHSLILMTRYLKQIGIFHRCLSLLILAEAPTEKKTVANGNGKGADYGSSEEVSSYQANDGLNASTETPISQSERSSISSSPDETATVDISSIAPTRTLESTWYIASAAAHHMTGVQDLLTNYTPLSEALDVHTPNMGRMLVLGSGSVNTTNITLQDVWFVPGLDANLVSTNQLTKLGHTVSLGPSGCRINKDSEDGALIGSAHFTDDYLFKVDFLHVEPTN